MSLQYIIDGYNIIHHPRFTQASRKKTRNVRQALLDLIKSAKLTGSYKNKVLVVFDGYPKSDENIEECVLGTFFEVLFSRDESADEKIKKIIEKSTNAKNIVVVSDDNEIRFFSKASKAKALSIDEFIPDKNKTAAESLDSVKTELPYSSIHKINEELRKKWLGQ